MIVTSTPESRLRFILVHALPLCIVWLLLAPLSVLISVHRHRMRKWFPLHIMLSLCVFFVTLMAAYPGYVKSEGKATGVWPPPEAQPLAAVPAAANGWAVQEE